MKILFLLTEIGAAVPSFHAISILSAVAKAAGHQTALFQARKMNFTRFDEAIQQERPDVLAATAVTQQLPYVTQLLAYCRQKHPHIKTTLGGTHAILRPHVIDAIPELDVLCVNEAERPFVDLLAAWERGERPTDIPNMDFRYGQDIVRHQRTYSCTEADMTALPFEDRELFPKWRNTPKGVPLESLGIRPRLWISRGCAFSCSFCSVPTLRKLYPEKKFVRYPTAERAIAEIESVADRWTFSTFVVDDDVMSHRPDWIVNEWARKYPERLKHLKWEANLRVETASEEVIRAFAETGCSLLKFGLESGDPWYRKHVFHRNITNEQTMEAFALAKKYGIKRFSFNILGGRDETRRMVYKTIRLNQRLKPDKCQISILFPYPGTPLGDDIIHAGDVVDGWEHIENYFERSAIKLKYMYPWEVKLYARFFRLFVYAAYSPRLAWLEIVGLAKKVRDRVFGVKKRYDLEIK